MSGHTKGPWLAGYWGGRCNITTHEHGRHPGPPECKYDHTFYPMTQEGDYVSFVGIVSAEPDVNIVWTEYDELKIRIEDAHLIAAAPDLLEALYVLAADKWVDLSLSEQATWLAKAKDAIAKAEGHDV